MDNIINEIKENFSGEFEYQNLKIEIDEDFRNDSDLETENLIQLGIKFADYYINNKTIVLDHIYNEFKKSDWYVDEYSKEEIFEKIGEPIIRVIDERLFDYTYLESKLDYDHIITVEVDVTLDDKFKLSYVSIDG